MPFRNIKVLSCGKKVPWAFEGQEALKHEGFILTFVELRSVDWTQSGTFIASQLQTSTHCGLLCGVNG